MLESSGDVRPIAERTSNVKLQLVVMCPTLLEHIARNPLSACGLGKLLLPDRTLALLLGVTDDDLTDIHRTGNTSQNCLIGRCNERVCNVDSSANLHAMATPECGSRSGRKLYEGISGACCGYFVEGLEAADFGLSATKALVFRIAEENPAGKVWGCDCVALATYQEYLKQLNF